MSIIAFSPAVGPVPLDVFIREKHEADLAITKVPVEVGADMTDHAYVEPSKLSLEIADRAGALTWGALERFQASRVPFTIVTGLKVYTNMLIAHMEAERDAPHGMILYGRVDLNEVLIAETATEADTGGSTRSTSGASSKLKSSKASGTETQARTAGTASRGDAVTTSVDAGSAKSQSIIKMIKGD